MATRTSSGEVIDILGDHFDGVSSLTGFIRVASVLTGKLAAADVLGVHDTDALKEIETWLAAHAYAHADQIAASDGNGKANSSYQGQTGMHFNSTQYGQMALVLDTTGFLSMLQKQAENGRLVASGTWLGARLQNDKSMRYEDQ